MLEKLPVSLIEGRLRRHLGRRHTPRARDGLFDIVSWELPKTVRRRAAHFGQTNPTNPTRVVPAKAGTHIPRSLVMGHGSPPASRASAGTTIFHENEEEPTCGCGKRSRAPFPCFRPVIYRERRNFNVLSRRRAVRRPSAFRSVARYFFCYLQERRGGVRAVAVAGRAFRTRGAVTACRPKESQGPP